MIRALALALAICTAAVSTTSAQEARTLADVTPLADGKQALDKGVQVLCPWFFSPASAATDGTPFVMKVRTIQMDNGYFRGSGPPIIFPMEPRQVSTSSVSMRAIIKGEAANDGIILFMQFHYPVCQMQVFGHADAAKSFASGVEKDGWTRVGKTVTNGDVQSDRYRKSATGPTLVVNRSLKSADGGLTMVVNYFSGNEEVRGELK